MDVAHLRCFVAVAEDLNFTRAARKLHMATSPLCRRIKSLELELGDALFIRTNHAVSLTPTGERLLPHARTVLADFDSLRLAAREENGGSKRTLTVGLPPMLHSRARDRFFDLLRDEFPAISVAPEVAGTSRLVERVLANELAVAFAHEPEQTKQLGLWPLMVERLGVAIPRSHAAAARRTVRLSDLVSLTHITSDNSSAPGFFARVNEQVRSRGVDCRLELPAHDAELTAHLVASGVGFALITLDPRSLARQTFVSERIAIRRVEDAALSLGTALVWRLDRARDDRQLASVVQALGRTFPEPMQA